MSEQLCSALRHDRGAALARSAPLAFALLACGCESELSFGTLRDLSDAMASDGGSRDATVPSDGSTDAPRPFSCSLRGAMYPVSDIAAGSCARPRGFHYALCSCDDVYNNQSFIVDAFDSRRGAYTPNSGVGGGSVGLHGALNALAGAEVPGSLIAQGAAQIGGDLSVGGDLWIGGTFGGAYPVRVGGNARLASDVYVRSLSVGGELTVGESARVLTDAGAFERTSLTVPAPCACNESIDRAALIAAARGDNDNAAIGLDAQSGLTAANADLDRTLPCGRYFVERVQAQRPITLRIAGRVALYVGGELQTEPSVPITITLADDAEFDLFVAQGITGNGPITIGSSDTSARVRLHSGSPNLLFRQGARIGGSIYAPRSRLIAEAPFELFGAAIVARAQTSTDVRLHYDRALNADGCSEAFCADASDCAAPLRCERSRCVP